MISRTTATATLESTGLQARLLDDNPRLLEQSYRLRYQVYCVERHFLHAEEYPEHIERDAFDRDSVHVGAVDRDDQLAATARLVKPSNAGLPLFKHCSLFPSEPSFADVTNSFVEVSRVSISRAYIRPRDAEPFLTLLKAVIYGARSVGATHLIGATDAALHRRLLRLGFPYRVAGPTVDYYGPVAPHIMSLAEFDEVVLSGQFPALKDFPIGVGLPHWRRFDEHGGHLDWNDPDVTDLGINRLRHS